MSRLERRRPSGLVHIEVAHVLRVRLGRRLLLIVLLTPVAIEIPRSRAAVALTAAALKFASSMIASVVVIAALRARELEVAAAPSSAAPVADSHALASTMPAASATAAWSGS